MSLRLRMVLAMALLILALGLGGTLHARVTLSDISNDQLQMRGVALANDLSAESSELLLSNDIFGLYQDINRLLLSADDIKYIVILGPDGEVRASNFEGGLPAGLREANAAAPGASFSARRLTSDQGDILDVAAPIMEGKLGTVRIGLSRQGLEQQVSDLTFRLLALTGAALIIGLAVAYGLAIVVIRPLSRLAEAARAVGRGDLDQRVEVTGQDEVGRLGEAFNAMTTDLARSRQQLESFHQQVIRQNEELSALNDTAVAVGRSLDVDQVLSSGLEVALRVASLKSGWILMCEGRGVGLAGRIGEVHGPRQAESCGCLDEARRRKAALLVDSARCPWIPRDHHDGRHIAVPLIARDEVLGLLCLAVDGTTPDRPLLDLLSAIGRYAGVALQNARLYEEVRRKEQLHKRLMAKVMTAEDEERRRIARELHDEAAQTLTALLLSLDALAESIPEGEQRARERLDRSRQLANAALWETRRLMLDLRPAALDDLGLVPAIRAYAERRLGDAVTLSIDAGPLVERRLPADLELTVFRIVQEAVNNCARHASARRVIIRLEQDGEDVTGSVCDDGQGFDFEAVLQRRDDQAPLGLLGMEERALLAGGMLEVESAPGRGTEVRFSLPLKEAAVT